MDAWPAQTAAGVAAEAPDVHPRVQDEHPRAVRGRVNPQERNGLLRREGIYSAYITEWRRERDRAAAPDAPERKPGRCPFTGSLSA